MCVWCAVALPQPYNGCMDGWMEGWSISLPKQFGMTQLVGGKMWRKNPKLSLMLLKSCLL